MATRKLHLVSGLIIAVFIGVHLLNHSISIWGAERHIEVMNRLRPFYRNIVVETVLLAAVLVQIVSGLRLFKANRKSAVTFFERLHIWTGLYLALFFIIHLSAVFVGRLLLHLDTNFYFGVAGINSFPFSLFFVPYYGLAIFSFFGHIAAVHRKKMTRNFLGFGPIKQAKAMLVFGLLVTVLIFYGLTNRFTGVPLPKEYRIIIGR